MQSKINIFLTLVAVLATGCSKSDVAKERPTPVGVEAVQAFNGNDVKRFSAVVQPYDQVDLSFRVGGYVDAIAQVPGLDKRGRSVQDGDHVAAGTVLARLHASDYTARVQQAKASVAETETMLAKARLDRDRAKKLFASQSMTKPEYDAAMSNYDATEARLLSARGRLTETSTSANDTVLRAPFAATVLKRNITSGTLASPGVPAFVLADTANMKAVFGVPDKLIGRMKIGNPLTLRAEAFTDTDLHGRVSRISASADPKSRVFEVEVTMPNQDGRLKSGMIAWLQIAGVPATAGLFVPLNAIVRPPGQTEGHAVFVVEKDKDHDVARIRRVQLGEIRGDRIQIASGLRGNEQVIVRGATLAVDAAAVRIVP